MEDLIRRSDAIKAIDDAFDSIPMEQTTEILKARRVIRTLPSTDRPQDDDWEKYSDKLWKNAYERGKADRPQGEWIEVTNGRGGHECSNCNAYAPSYMNGDEHLSDYCPDCGAKMKGADDE